MPHESADEESFDSLYRSTRRALLLQTYALTGDLPVARAAVRAAYVSAWRHWRTVSTLEDPTTWLRTRAWRHTRRRRTVGARRRTATPSPEQRAVLDALGHLPSGGRRALVLVDLAGLDHDRAASELGEDPEQAGVVTARRRVAEHLGVPVGDVAGRLKGLDALLDDVTQPRSTMLRRAVRSRRRTQLVVAAVVATLVVVGIGAFATHPEGTSAEELGLVRPSGPARTDGSAMMPTSEDLLYAEQMSRFGPTRTWHTARTGNNTTGNGINTVCQEARFADPSGYAALVRSFRASGKPARRAVQTVEVSRSRKAAARAFRTTVGWYAGCQVARLQVVDAYHVDHVGDQADVLTLRVGRTPARTISVAVARAGSVTTSTVGTSAGGAPPPVREVTRSLGEAVEKLCARTGSPGCVGTPTFRAVPPPPTGDERGLLATADLPPVGRIDDPWVGTDPVSPTRNPAATTCDRASFSGAGAAQRRSRTFLVPQADVPTRFGLTETSGRFRTPRAAARFLADVRRRVSGCEKRDLATSLDSASTHRTHRTDRSTWALTTEVSETEKVRFRVGFVQVGRRVAQLTFAPTSSDDMTERSFDALVVRAGERLRQLR
jgi:DNA-directed RNA polymerase specialized sigma24 family protein